MAKDHVWPLCGDGVDAKRVQWNRILPRLAAEVRLPVDLHIYAAAPQLKGHRRRGVGDAGGPYIEGSEHRDLEVGHGFAIRRT
jgi:hypothetical protein